jgi:hypothetical protein
LSDSKEHIMIAPLATIVSLSVLWLAIVAVARTLEHSGATIMAALAGRSPLATARSVEVPVRVSNRAAARQQRPLRATPTLRAAA